MKLLSCNKLGHDYELDVEVETTSTLDFILRRKSFKVVRYVGDVSVFHNASTGELVNSSLSLKLNAILWKWKYDNIKKQNLEKINE